MSHYSTSIPVLVDQIAVKKNEIKRLQSDVIGMEAHLVVLSNKSESIIMVCPHCYESERPCLCFRPNY
jgi:hypothetical protein